MTADRDVDDEPGSKEPLVRLGVLHARLGWLCDQLETFADKLPTVGADACLQAIWGLTTVLVPLQSIEENCFFPLLRHRNPHSANLAASIERSIVEHVEDRDAMAELVDGIRKLSEGVGRQRIDVLSYQLRAFFVGLRRHEAREREVLFEAASTSFDMDDARALGVGLDASFGR